MHVSLLTFEIFHVPRPFGGFNDCTIPDGKCWQEFLIAIAGPLMQVPLMFIWLIVMAIAAPEGVSYYGTVGFDIDRLDDGGGGEWFAQLAKRSLDINIMIFALNLMLPAYPLDAASMVAALCGQCGLSIVRSAWVLVIIGAILGAAAALMGIVYLVAGSGPGVFLLLMGLYVMYTSWQMHSQIKDGTIYSHPIFKPDCYRRDSPQNNHSRSMPVVRRAPPASPRRNTGAGLTVPTIKSKTPMGAMSRPIEMTSSPTRDRRANVGDIEMGNAPRAEKKVKSTLGEKKKKKKKKTPATNDPTTPVGERTSASDTTTGNGTNPQKKKSSGSGKKESTV